MKHIRFKTTNQSDFYRDMMCSGFALLDEDLNIQFKPEIGIVWLGKMVKAPPVFEEGKDEELIEVKPAEYYDGEYADILLEKMPNMKNCRHTVLIEPFGGHEFFLPEPEPKPEPEPLTDEQIAMDMIENPDKYLDELTDIIMIKLLEEIKALKSEQEIRT